MNTPINIALADDHTLLREGIVKMLSDYPEFKVVISAPDGKILLEQIKQFQEPIHVVLTDIDMPVMDGFLATKQIKKLYPRTKVIAITMHDDDGFIQRMLQFGINGYLLKGCEIDNLVSAIRAVNDSNGSGNYYTDRMSNAMHKQMKRDNAVSSKLQTVHFTPKEMQVIQLICEELTAKAIAERMNITTHTVNGHRERIMWKLKVKTTIGIVNYAHKHNLVTI